MTAAAPDLIPKPGDRNYAAFLHASKHLLSTLVVGGETSFVLRKIAPRLVRHGLHVVGHWPYRRMKGAFPANIDVLVILTDMVGHSMNDAAVEEANRRGIPIIMGVRKYAILQGRLAEAGFPEISALSPKPAVSTKRTPAASPVELKQVENTPFVRPLVLPPEAEPSPVPLPLSSSETDNVPQPHKKIETFEKNFAAVRGIYAEVLMKEPNLSNKDVFARVVTRARERGLDPGKPRLDVMAKIRKRLGVVLPRNSYTPKNNLRLRDAEGRTLSIPNLPAPTHAPAEVPPVVEAVAPPEVTPAPRPAPSQDVRELVQMLRTAMAAEGIERLTVTKDTVNFRRVVVEEGEYEV